MRSRRGESISTSLSKSSSSLMSSKSCSLGPDGRLFLRNRSTEDVPEWIDRGEAEPARIGFRASIGHGRNGFGFGSVLTGVEVKL
jgi:hypothetical protein